MNVHFVITMPEKELEKAEKQGFHEFFKLTTRINTTNMVCFDFDGKIKKYTSPEEIIEDFYPQRLVHYQKRKVGSVISYEQEGRGPLTSTLCRIIWRASYRSSSTDSTTKRALLR